MRWLFALHILLIGLFSAPVLAQHTSSSNPTGILPPSPPPPPPVSGNPIQHIIRIVMENRTTDHYFGTYGIATQTGTSTSGSATLQLTNVSALHVGDYLSGPGFQPVSIGSPLIQIGAINSGANTVTLQDMLGNALTATTSTTATYTTQPVNGYSQVTWPCTNGGTGFGAGQGGLYLGPGATNCITNWHSTVAINEGGGHNSPDAKIDLNNGSTTFAGDGYVKNAAGITPSCFVDYWGQIDCASELEAIYHNDAISYHNASEIPNYWTYAASFVLFDNWYEPVRTYSMDSHVYEQSEFLGGAGNGACTDVSLTNVTLVSGSKCATTSGAVPATVGVWQILTDYNPGAKLIPGSAASSSGPGGTRVVGVNTGTCTGTNKIEMSQAATGNTSTDTVTVYNPSTCATNLGQYTPGNTTVFSWLSLPQVWDQNGITWKWYSALNAQGNSTPNCDNSFQGCAPQIPKNTTGNDPTEKMPAIWNTIPYQAWVKGQPAAYRNTHLPDNLNQLYQDIATCSLSQVSIVVPSSAYSEHPDGRVDVGMQFVTSIVNAVMNESLCNYPVSGNNYSTWQSTAIFVYWDDWGGFADHMLPPNIDCTTGSLPACTDGLHVQGWGIRVPAMLITAWAKGANGTNGTGYVDHRLASSDQIDTLITKWFMASPQYLNPNDAALNLGNANLIDIRSNSGLTAPRVRDDPAMPVQFAASNPQNNTTTLADLSTDFVFPGAGGASVATSILTTHIPAMLKADCWTPNNTAIPTTAPVVCPSTGSSVTLTWVGVPTPGGSGPVSGTYTYTVYKDGSPLGACTAISAVTCTDAAITAGQHFYDIISIVGGVNSPHSAQVELNGS